MRLVKYKRRKSLLRRRLTLLICVALIVALISGWVANFNSLLVRLTEANIRSITTTAVNEAIMYTLTDEYRYDDLFKIDRDEQGKITTIISDSLKINKIARDTTYLSIQYLDRMIGEGIYLPIGAFTGIEGLAGFGKKVHIDLIPVSNIDVHFLSQFVACGVNQTKHSIYMHLIADITVIMPAKNLNLSSVNEVLVCENVLIGEIPETYLQSDNFSTGIDLVPDV